MTRKTVDVELRLPVQTTARAALAAAAAAGGK